MGQCGNCANSDAGKGWIWEWRDGARVKVPCPVCNGTGTC
ncbi:hypothetical protein SAMN05421773_113133 [Streptomyces aidingensis]|uniref:Uncharacterized protein n=1 Tax=Streptomyces aidingensis TaxID=910347 RepID=A0A1I1RQ68_9ACTN|nr:hypothetical protein SAMN05421773_113133 [Streptomyces aidingensis]